MDASSLLRHDALPRSSWHDCRVSTVHHQRTPCEAVAAAAAAAAAAKVVADATRGAPERSWSRSSRRRPSLFFPAVAIAVLVSISGGLFRCLADCGNAAIGLVTARQLLPEPPVGQRPAVLQEPPVRRRPAGLPEPPVRQRPAVLQEPPVRRRPAVLPEPQVRQHPALRPGGRPGNVPGSPTTWTQWPPFSAWRFLQRDQRSTDHGPVQTPLEHSAHKKVRPYQEEAVAHFFKHAPAAAAEGRHLKFQMSCGTGKTYVYGLIISRDIRLNPTARYVVFVPWRDLAKQTTQELKAFGLSTTTCGDMEEPDPSASVVVCVYRSAKRLCGQDFRIKIVDEAHHLETETSAFYKRCVRIGVTADLAADFTATFHDTTHVDFAFSHDQAVEAGFVTDFRVSVPVISEGDRVAAIARLVAANCSEWAPMFVIFNSMASATRCARLMARLGVPAKAIPGAAPKSARQEAKEALRTGELKALCLVRLFNEGTSINELRTVVFGDNRQQCVSVQQLAMRVTRLCPKKEYGNIVVPVKFQESTIDNEDLKSVVQPLSQMSPTFKRRVQAKSAGSSWLRVFNTGIQRARRSDDDSEDDQSGVLMTVMYDRLARCVNDDSGQVFDLWLERLRSWSEANNGIAPRAQGFTKAGDVEEAELATWLRNVRDRYLQGKISDTNIAKFRTIGGMQQMLQRWEFTRSNPQWEDMCSLVRAWAEQHGSLPRKGTKNLEERMLQEWLVQAVDKYKRSRLSKSHVQQLEQVPGIQQRVDRPGSRARSWDDWCADMREWLVTHPRKTPQTRSPNAKERSLSYWLCGARRKYKDEKLSAQQVTDIEDIFGTVDVLEYSRLPGGYEFDTNCDKLQDWIEQHAGKLPRKKVPGRDEKEKELAHWFYITKGKYVEGKLSREQVQQLESIPGLSEDFQNRWKPAMQYQRDLHITELEEWFQEHNGAPPQLRAPSAKEGQLASWLKRLRDSYNRHELTDEQATRMAHMPGIDERKKQRIPSWRDGTWQARSTVPKWEERCSHLQAWVEKYGGGLPTWGAKDAEGKSLAVWLHDTRQMYRRGKLSNKRLAALEKVPGMALRLASWEIPWDKRYRQLQSWVRQNVGALPSGDANCTEEKALAVWLYDARQLYQKRDLTSEQIAQLQNVPGMSARIATWDRAFKRVTWEQRCDQLQRWMEKHQGALPTWSDNDTESAALFKWLARTKVSLHTHELTEEQMSGLKQIPGLMKKLAGAIAKLPFEGRCMQLREYLAQHNGSLPSGYGDADSKVLSKFVSNTKCRYLRFELAGENEDMLREIPGMSAVLEQWKQEQSDFPTTWDERCTELEAWVKAHNALPRRTSDKTSNALTRWLTKLKDKYKQGVLREELLVRLERIPLLAPKLSNWMGPLQQRWSWEDRYDQLRVWMDRHEGKLPEAESDDPEESDLARWIQGLRPYFSNGYLTDDQVARLQEVSGLTEILAKWSVGLWDLHCKHLERWVQRRGSLPRRGITQDIEEMFLARWLSNTQMLHRCRKLSDDQMDKLRFIPGMEERLAQWKKRRERSSQRCSGTVSWRPRISAN